MILWVWDCFRKLSLYHYRMIMATILVPVIWTVAFNYFEVDCWGLHFRGRQPLGAFEGCWSTIPGLLLLEGLSDVRWGS